MLRYCIAMSTWAFLCFVFQGVLTGKYTPEQPPPGVRGSIYNSNRLREVQELLDLIKLLGQSHNKNMAEVRWFGLLGGLPKLATVVAQQVTQHQRTQQHRTQQQPN